MTGAAGRSGRDAGGGSGVRHRIGLAGVVLALVVAGAPLVALDAAGADVRSEARTASAAPPAILRAPRLGEQYAPTRIDVAPRVQPANPFDPDEVMSRVVAIAPDGNRRLHLAFWYQPFTRSLVDGREQLTPSGEPRWQVRIAPDQPGRWRWYLEGHDPLGSWRTRARTLWVRPSDRHGPLQRAARSDRHLRFADGTPYFAVGENLGWADARGTYAYDQWLGELASVGGSFARLWMASWSFGIEWTDTGLGDYTQRLDRAWQLDRVLATADAHGVQIELALLNHGAFSTAFNSEWAANPYNVANGGPLTRPQDFFTDPQAKAMFRQRLFYVIARWGAAPNLMAWELWNEVDLTDGFDAAAVSAWHAEMADVIRFVDPHDHLVSSSTAIFGNEPTLWGTGKLDFAQVHHYARIGDVPFLPNLFTTVPLLTDLRRSQAPTLPVLFAELGVDSRGPAETMAVDPDGIGVHDGLWAGVVSGGFGTAMPWWWDSIIHPEWERYAPMYRAVSRFVHGVPFHRADLVGVTPGVGGAPPEVAALAQVGPRHALVWVKDQGFQWIDPVERTVVGATVTLDLAPGSWCGRWVDTWTGQGRGAVQTSGGTVTLPVPTFDRDLALRLQRCRP